MRPKGSKAEHMKRPHGMFDHLRFLWQSLSPWKWVYVLSFIFMQAYVVIRFLIPYVSERYFTHLENDDVEKTLMLAYAALAAYTAVFVVQYFGHVLGYWSKSVLIRNLRLHLLRIVQRLPAKRMQAWQKSDLFQRITNETENYSNVLGSIIEGVVFQVIIILVIGGYMLTINWRIALIVFIGLPLSLLAGYGLRGKLQTIGHQVNEQTAQVRKKIQNSLKGYETIQAYDAQAWLVAQYEDAHRRLNKLLMKQYGLNAAVKLLSSTASLTTIWVGMFFIAWFAVHGTMTTGQLIAFLLLIWNLHFPLTVIGAHYGHALQATGASRRVLEVYSQDTEELREENRKPASAGHCGYDVVLQGVTFRNTVHGDSQNTENGFAIRDLDLEIKAGSVVALLGENGSGKSTVARICAGLLKPDGGTVFVRRRVDGSRSDDIASHVTLVPQQPVVFTASAAENIRLGREDASFEDIVEAARMAEAHAFIANLEDGYDTVIHDGMLSGGEKQRIALARALLARRPILILDEATSALDNETKERVMANIRRYAARNGMTLILIAHEWPVAGQADEIYVLDRGVLSEHGDLPAAMKRKAGLTETGNAGDGGKIP